ncbi:MAG: hypothetical protein JEZ05_06850 [Tenericutes bacterium]|nr:hypothetical protein [Mycoplasmatota bacterium]
MPNSKKRKEVAEVKDEKGMKAFNPTKSRVGRVIILILAIGMFLGMLIAAIIGIANVF